MKKTYEFLIKSCLEELENNNTTAASLFLNKAILLAEVEAPSKEDYLKNLLYAALGFLKKGNYELVESILDEVSDISGWTAPESERHNHKVKRTFPTHRNKAADNDTEDTDKKEEIVDDKANKELLEKMNTLVFIMKEFFDLFFKSKLPTELKDRESEDIRNFKTQYYSKFTNAFKILKRGLSDFSAITLSEEENDRIEKYLKLQTVLKNVPQKPVK